MKARESLCICADLLQPSSLTQIGIEFKTLCTGSHIGMIIGHNRSKIRTYNKARILLLVDLRELFSELGPGTGKKGKKRL